MNHENIKEKLLAFYDQELPEIERQEIKGHLVSCQECAETLKRWEAVSRAIGKIKLDSDPDFFVRRVMNKIEDLERPAVPELRRSFMPKWAMPVLGYGLAFGLMFLAIAYREQPAWSTEGVLMADLPQESQMLLSDESVESSLFGK